jgi:hypothetical protein
MAGTGKTLPCSLPYCIGVCPGASELNHEKIPFVLTDVLAVIRIWLLEVQQRQEMKWTWTALPMK